jgi:hypothetical protein
VTCGHLPLTDPAPRVHNTQSSSESFERKNTQFFRPFIERKWRGGIEGGDRSVWTVIPTILTRHQCRVAFSNGHSIGGQEGERCKARVSTELYCMQDQNENFSTEIYERMSAKKDP